MSLTNTKTHVQRVERSRLSGVDFDNLPFGSIFSDHMLVADYKDGQWEQPRIVPYAPISLAPAASVLHYGQSIFEGFKTFRLHDGGTGLFRVRDNLARFNPSAKRMAMPQFPESLFIEGIAELIRVDRDWVPATTGASLYVRPVCFATDAALFVRPSNTYRLVVFTCPVGQYFSEPLRLVTEEHYVRAFPGGTGAIKAAGNYGGALVAGRQAQEQGFHSVLWLDGPSRKCIEESGLMNIFFVIDGSAITPPLGGTILAGVTRDSVIVLLHELGVDVVERPISVDEVVEAYKNRELSEAFAVGTAATVASVESIRHRDVEILTPVQRNGSIAAKLLRRMEAIRTGVEPDKYEWLHRI